VRRCHKPRAAPAGSLTIATEPIPGSSLFSHHHRSTMGPNGVERPLQVSDLDVRQPERARPGARASDEVAADAFTHVEHDVRVVAPRHVLESPVEDLAVERPACSVSVDSSSTWTKGFGIKVSLSVAACCPCLAGPRPMGPSP